MTSKGLPYKEPRWRCGNCGQLEEMPRPGQMASKHVVMMGESWFCWTCVNQALDLMIDVRNPRARDRVA